MKRVILSGLAAIVLASGAAGCGGPDQTLHNNVNSLPSPTATALPPKPDLTLKLDGLRSFEDPTLIINDELHYLFVRRDGKYSLQRIEPDQKTKLVVSLSDPNHDQSVNIDLGDFGRVYTLSYNSDFSDYQISLR